MPVRAATFALLGTLVYLGGCEALRVSRPLGSPDGDPVALSLPLEATWRYNMEAASGPTAPLVVGQHLLLATRNGTLHVLERGERAPRRLGRMSYGDALETAPLLQGGRIAYIPVAAGKHGVVAYDLVAGRARWTLRRSPHAAGLLIAEGTLVSAALDGTVRGLDPATGAERWRLRPDSAAGYRATPVEAGGRVVVADDQGRVTALDPATGAVTWTRRLETPVLTTPAVAHELVVVPTSRGRLFALDVRDGRVAWTFDAEDPEVRFASPAVAASQVYVGGTDGMLRALEARTGRAVWVFETDGAFTTAPLVTGGLLFAGSLDKRLVALDATTGELRWETQLRGRPRATPVLWGGQLVVLAEPHEAYAFRPTARPTQ
ncbi:MAG TPA: PQQ-binding-like beta-propeller repeat protein [Rubricoccaceae bacterium]|nr:PQQ-binding-like beta-propeller repeat protein [Rubricoccaceae bacterium]